MPRKVQRRSQTIVRLTIDMMMRGYVAIQPCWISCSVLRPDDSTMGDSFCDGLAASRWTTLDDRGNGRNIRGAYATAIGALLCAPYLEPE
jgi:hypothetical protein